MAASLYDLSVTDASNTSFNGISQAENSMLPSQVNNDIRAKDGAIARYIADEWAVNTATGTDTYALTAAQGITAYATGIGLRFICPNTNTGAATLNVNTIGAKAVRKISGGTDVALVAGDLAAGETYTVIYRASANSAAGGWVLVGAAAVAAATSSTNGTVNLTQLGIAYNVGIAASVGSSALTVSLKGADGNDPSATNPVVVPFRNATLATGTPVMRTVTAATSIVVASTKTMGTSNGVAFRLWVVAVDTGSGIELGLVNALSGTSIMSLSSSDLYSPTATPANSAQVIYTTSGQTSKPICVLGYLDFSSGEATAGTWATAPDRIQVRNLGTKLPGDTIQVLVSQTGTNASGTTVIPNDNTIPQNTEGDQYQTQAITPTFKANVLFIEHQGTYTSSAINSMTAALFQDSTANALAASGPFLISTAGNALQLSLRYRMAAGTTSSTTLKIRSGGSAAGTTIFNGYNGSQVFNGTANSFLSVTEIMA